MRVSREKAAENRARILAEAARLFRERGIAGVGVDALSEAAGLTHGSLYSQFGSKDNLVAEALRQALDGSAAKYGDVRSLSEYAARYLSPRHRDAPGGGCAIAALAGELPHQGEPLRGTFTDGLRRMVGRLTALLETKPKQQRADEALAIAAMLVGGLTLSRAVDDPVLSNRILAACRARLNEA